MSWLAQSHYNSKHGDPLADYHPMGLSLIMAALPMIQLPANVLKKAMEDDSSIWVLATHVETRMKLLDPG